MTGQFTLRRAAPRDAVAVGALLDACYGKLFPAGYDATLLQAALPIITMANLRLLASGRFLIATAPDDQLVGCGGWSAERPDSQDIVPDLGHIRHFGTHPDWTRRGVAAAIMARCVDDATSSGVVRFDCYSSLVAEGFYRACGFVSVGPFDVTLPGGIVLPSVLMQRGGVVMA